MCEWEDSIRPVVCPDCLEEGGRYPLQEAVKLVDMRTLYCSVDLLGVCPKCSTTFPVRFKLDQDYDEDDTYEWTYLLPN